MIHLIQPLNQATTFAVTDTKFYLPVVTLSTDDNAKLPQQLKSGNLLEQISIKSSNTGTKPILRLLN